MLVLTGNRVSVFLWLMSGMKQEQIGRPIVICYNILKMTRQQIQ